MKKEHRRMRGKRHSVAGIACPCCNKWGCHPRKMKAKERRYERRTAKHKLHSITFTIH